MHAHVIAFSTLARPRLLQASLRIAVEHYRVNGTQGMWRRSISSAASAQHLCLVVKTLKPVPSLQLASPALGRQAHPSLSFQLRAQTPLSGHESTKN